MARPDAARDLETHAPLAVVRASYSTSGQVLSSCVARRNGNPPPVFDVHATHVGVTVTAALRG